MHLLEIEVHSQPKRYQGLEESSVEEKKQQDGGWK